MCARVAGFLPRGAIGADLFGLLDVEGLPRLVVLPRRALQVHTRLRRPDRRRVRARAPPDAVAQPFGMRLETQKARRVGKHRVRILSGTGVGSVEPAVGELRDQRGEAFPFGAVHQDREVVRGLRDVVLMPPANLPAIRACRSVWNKGRIVGQKRPLLPKHVWAIRVRLKIAKRVRDLALFNLAIDSKLRGCDLVQLKVADVFSAGQVKSARRSLRARRGTLCFSRSLKGPASPSPHGLRTRR